MKTCWIYFLLFALCSCHASDHSKQVSSLEKKGLDLPAKPNILWLVTEDMSPYIPSFGDSTIQTTNLSRLAKEGVRFPNTFSVSGVCAPSRACIATGMYPTSFGANNMRVNSYTKETGLPAYEAIPPTNLKMLSEWFRKEGYYCTNNYKTDYQFKHPVTAWDECSTYAHWRNRKGDQPFYAVFNFTDTHESGLFEPYGFRNIETRHYHEGDRSYKWGEGRMSENQTPIHLPKDTEFKIPPYLPNSETVRRDIWKEYNNIAEMDKQIGVVLKQLEEDGLLENTIIFFYGDHGGPYPRQKRLVYDSGLNTPLIIRYPKKQLAGTIDSQMISFVDFVPTMLSYLGIEAPEYLQGRAFAGKLSKNNPRNYIHAAADRFDAERDVIRAVRDRRFKYIRNYKPDQGYYLPVKYRERIPTMQELLHLRDLGALDSIQSQLFRESKPTEELFDCENDPHEIHNIASDPKYKEKLVELRLEMDRWLVDIGDDPHLPEADLIKKLWNGKDVQPQTQLPVIEETANGILVSCATKGASIGYKVEQKPADPSVGWIIYDGDLELPKSTKIQIKAHRIGYKPSKVITYKF